MMRRKFPMKMKILSKRDSTEHLEASLDPLKRFVWILLVAHTPKINTVSQHQAMHALTATIAVGHFYMTCRFFPCCYISS